MSDLNDIQAETINSAPVSTRTSGDWVISELLNDLGSFFATKVTPLYTITVLKESASLDYILSVYEYELPIFQQRMTSSVDSISETEIFRAISTYVETQLAFIALKNKLEFQKQGYKCCD